MTDELNKIYEEKFKPLYKKGDFTGASELLLEYVKLNNYLSNQESKVMLCHFLEKSRASLERSIKKIEEGI